IQERNEVIGIVFQRFSDGLTHSFGSSKVYNPRNIRIVLDKTCRAFYIAKIKLVKLWLYANNFLDLIQHLDIRIREIVDNNRCVPGFNKFDDSMRSDMPCSSCYLYFAHVLCYCSCNDLKYAMVCNKPSVRSTCGAQPIKLWAKAISGRRWVGSSTGRS